MAFRRLLILTGIESCDLIRDALVYGLRLEYPALEIAFDYKLAGCCGPWDRRATTGHSYHTACNLEPACFDPASADLVLASECSLDGLYGERGETWLRALLEPYRDRLVSFNGADHPQPPEHERPVLRELAILRFVAQCPPTWLADARHRAAAFGIATHRLPPYTNERTIDVMFGGTWLQGHGGRWELLESAVRHGLIDLLVQGQPGWRYLEMVGRARAAVAIGCAGNYPRAGLNTKHLESVCMGTPALSFPPGVVLPDEPEEGREWLSFRTAEELVDLCKHVRAGDVAPIPPARIAHLCNAHSARSRARQFVRDCQDKGIVA